MSTPRHLSSHHELAEYANITIRTGLMYAVMILAHLALLPLWSIIAANIILYFSVYVSVHELGHNYRANQLHLIGRFIPVGTPIWGGIRVFQETHRRHHLYFCTDQDPWLPFYAGAPLRALLFNLLEPEVNLRAFAKKQGVDRELVASCLFSLAFTVAGLWLFGTAYLVYLVSMRLTHGLAVFFFNFTLHRDRLRADADYSVYSRANLVRPIFGLARLIWGKAVVLGYMHHDRHHCLRQWRYHPLDYETIESLADYSPFIKDWPSRTIRTLAHMQARQPELPADMPSP